MFKVCVLGWYDTPTGKKSNLGDESFKLAFKTLWPSIDFTFTDKIESNINNYDSLWIGGGSFLDNDIEGINNKITIPILFLGVGLGHNIKKENKALLDQAFKVIVRDTYSLNFCKKATSIADLSYSLYEEKPLNLGRSKQVVILLNDFLTPHTLSPLWVSTSYDWFLHSFGSICNDLIDEGYVLHFIPMCTGYTDDRRINGSLIGRIPNRERVIWYLNPVTLTELNAQISISEFVITQRFHGIVFSSMLGIPYISLNCHDKLKGINKEIGWSHNLDYYGINNLDFKAARYNLEEDRYKLIEYSRTANALWKFTSDTIKKELHL